MAVTKMYVDSIVTGVRVLRDKPKYPKIGDCYFDTTTGEGFIWTNTGWAQFSGEPEPQFQPPTKEQLEKHPALKQAWEELLVIKKILGV